jgi:guanylate kinase
MVAEGELLEWAEYAGNYYGTPRAQVERQIQQGRLVILEIEVVGARKINQTFPAALRIFILPPSLAELERRIRDRGQDSEAEIEAADEFDVQIINNDVETALLQLEATIFSTAS